MTIREEWVDTFDTEPWELIEDGEDKGKIKEADYTYVQWLEQKADDYRLMLKALAETWVCVYEEDFNCWSWSSFEDVIEGQYKKIKVKSTQSDIPEINNELREEFKTI